MTTPTCPTCHNAQLKLKKKYRMSTPVVIIGWLILIPSFFGILFGVLGLFSTGTVAATSSESIDQVIRTRLGEANIPLGITDSVIAGRVVTAEEKSGLSQDQRNAVAAAVSTINSAKLGAGAGVVVAGGLSVGLIVMSFVGGLIGWLLVMKKKVLQCPSCAAVVAAS